MINMSFHIDTKLLYFEQGWMVNNWMCRFVVIPLQNMGELEGFYFVYI